MSSSPKLPRIPREARLPALAVASIAITIVVVLMSSGSSTPAPTQVSALAATTTTRPVGSRASHDPSSAATRTVTVTTTTAAAPKQNKQPSRTVAGTPLGAGDRASLPLEVGQVIIGTYAGTVPPQSMLNAVKAGQVGAIILMGDNTAGGAASVSAATHELQLAAKEGGNPGLLIMTDQEGGEVKRLAWGPPDGSAAEMGAAGDAQKQGVLTGELLKSVGINVDLAPVADVVRVDGFIYQEQRSFGRNPGIVAEEACAFARGLNQGGVAYTLKHFPGLGSAIQSTDGAPVHVEEPLADLAADDEAYGICGSGSRTLVMVSSASYQGLTGYTPAVLDPVIYQHVIPDDGIHAVTISDSFESGAIQGIGSPAMTALNAGLDMVMYPDYESASANAYTTLLQDADQGSLVHTRLQQAYDEVRVLKQALGLE